jgi:hypothetical protein
MPKAGMQDQTKNIHLDRKRSCTILNQRVVLLVHSEAFSKVSQLNILCPYVKCVHHRQKFLFYVDSLPFIPCGLAFVDLGYNEYVGVAEYSLLAADSR